MEILKDDFCSGLLKFDSAGIILGVYLTGSISLNDFQPDKSDLDFVVLCTSLPVGEMFGNIKLLQHHLNDKFPKTQLNGVFLTPVHLQIDSAFQSEVLTLLEGQWKTEPFAMAPITLMELKHHAITLHGIPAEDLPVTIAREQVNTFLYENMNGYWKNWIRQHSFFFSKKMLLILFPGISEWVILGMARQWFTLVTGQIVSKTEAGYFCLSMMPDRFRPIIQEVITSRGHRYRSLMTFRNSYNVVPSWQRAQDTIACARYMLEQFNAAYLTLKS